jgi:hypothetical protein
MKYYFGYLLSRFGHPIPVKWYEDQGTQIGPRDGHLMRIELSEYEYDTLPLAYFMGKYPYKP